MNKKSKSPWLTAILNFIIFGVGYIYTGKKVLFGILLLITDIILTSSVFLYHTNLIYSVPFNLACFLLGIAFAYDGYKTAEEINNKK